METFAINEYPKSWEARRDRQVIARFDNKREACDLAIDLAQKAAATGQVARAFRCDDEGTRQIWP